MNAWMFAAAASMGLAACSSGSGLKPLDEQESKEDVSYATQYAGPRSPASAYCVQLGGTLVLKTPKSLDAACRLPDGKTVDAWELFWRDNGKN